MYVYAHESGSLRDIFQGYTDLNCTNIYIIYTPAPSGPFDVVHTIFKPYMHMKVGVCVIFSKATRTSIVPIYIAWLQAVPLMLHTLYLSHMNTYACTMPKSA